VVEAVQFTDRSRPPRGVFFWPNGFNYVVTIHLAEVEVKPGDWIITEPDGEHHYPCKADIFAETYEPIEEPPDEAFWPPEDPRWGKKIEGCFGGES
jgi:hypothetical protein